MKYLWKVPLAAAVIAMSLAGAALPPGRQISVRLGQSLSSDKNRSGDSWDGTLASDVLVDGRVVAKRGAPVRGTIAEADASGRLSGTAYLKLRVTSVDRTPVNTEVLTWKGKTHKGRDVKAAGGTAALGAVIGAIAGGGRGAAIGAGAGAATGTAAAAATGKKDIRIPVETILNFRVE